MEREFFFFRLGELRLGVPSDLVREVIRSSKLTPLPRAPSFLLGVCGHRGEVLPVLDLLRFLGKGESRPGPRSRLFVATSGAFVAGVLVDAVAGIERIPPSEILPAPMGDDAATEHLMGIVQRKGQELVSLINLARLLQVARQRVVSR